MEPPLTAPFRIGDVEISNRVLLAPLAGIGNWFVRLQARRAQAAVSRPPETITRAPDPASTPASSATSS